MPHTNEELLNNILKITLLIQQKHPELSNFLQEMPITIPNEEHPHLNNKIFEDYYESLQSMLQRYEQEHNIA